MKRLRFWAGAVAGVLVFCGAMGGARAATLIFSFDMTYNAAAATTSGNTTNLVDYSVGLVDGQTYHASFSYDSSVSPTSTSNNGLFNIALYPATLSFSIPSLTVSNAGATADVHDSLTPVLGDFFQVTAITNPSAPAGHVIFDTAKFSFNSSWTLFTTTALPTTLNLSDFFGPQFLLDQTDVLATGEAFGETSLQFDLTNVTVTSATPVPAALPLFATGLGGLGLLGWRRKKKAAALAA